MGAIGLLLVAGTGVRSNEGAGSIGTEGIADGPVAGSNLAGAGAGAAAAAAGQVGHAAPAVAVGQLEQLEQAAPLEQLSQLEQDVGHEVGQVGHVEQGLHAVVTGRYTVLTTGR